MLSVDGTGLQLFFLETVEHLDFDDFTACRACKASDSECPDCQNVELELCEDCFDPHIEKDSPNGEGSHDEEESEALSAFEVEIVTADPIVVFLDFGQQFAALRSHLLTKCIYLTYVVIALPPCLLLSTFDSIEVYQIIIITRIYCLICYHGVLGFWGFVI